MFSRRRRYGIFLLGAIVAGLALAGAFLLSSTAAPTSSSHITRRDVARPHSNAGSASIEASPSSEQTTEKPHAQASGSDITIYEPCGSPTPCNQDALDSVLEGAEKMAGHRYLAGGAIDTDSNTASLYLVAGTPESIINEIEAKYSNVHALASASHTLSALRKLENEIAVDAPALQASGVAVRSIAPTLDGHLQIGVANNVGAAAAVLESRYGADWIRVVKADVIIQF